ALAAVTASPAGAVSVGEIDTFSSSIEGWFAGGVTGNMPPSPPVVIPNGGPGGLGDAYLSITATGGMGAGGRLVAMNGSQWAGDYLAAGVAAIEMDLRNFGTTDLTVRLLFEDPAGGPPTNIAATSFGASVRAGADWTRFRFPIAPSELVALQGDASAALSGSTLIRIYHSVPVAFPGDPIAGNLGVDNIAAIPEPETAALM